VQHEGQHDTVHQHKEEIHEHHVPSHIDSDRRGDVEPRISTSISDHLLDVSAQINVQISNLAITKHRFLNPFEDKSNVYVLYILCLKFKQFIYEQEI
jgi:hypothetical protein